jgi:hypothetical protein
MHAALKLGYQSLHARGLTSTHKPKVNPRSVLDRLVCSSTTKASPTSSNEQDNRFALVRRSVFLLPEETNSSSAINPDVSGDVAGTSEDTEQATSHKGPSNSNKRQPKGFATKSRGKKSFEPYPLTSQCPCGSGQTYEVSPAAAAAAAAAASGAAVAT